MPGVEIIIGAVVTSIVSGAATGAVTVIALRVHVGYLREAVASLESRVGDVEVRTRTTRQLVVNKLTDH